MQKAAKIFWIGLPWTLGLGIFLGAINANPLAISTPPINSITVTSIPPPTTGISVKERSPVTTDQFESIREEWRDVFSPNPISPTEPTDTTVDER